MAILFALLAIGAILFLFRDAFFGPGGLELTRWLKEIWDRLMGRIR